MRARVVTERLGWTAVAGMMAVAVPTAGALAFDDVALFMR
jgi:hypothetical protein